MELKSITKYWKNIVLLIKSNKYMRRLLKILIITLSLSFIFIVYGSIPFLTIPTLDQTIWSMGFAQSFANQSILSIHANNFGAPQPAAIAFGLTGAYPTSLFIRLGFHPTEAYTLMIMLWLSVAFFFTFRISRQFNLSFLISTLTSILWLTLPMIWYHSAYSMLSIGIALLSFYFYITLVLFDYFSHKNIILVIILYLASTIIAVFTDGYTFMMFAVASTIIAIFSYFYNPQKRKYFLKIAIPVHVLSFLIAYVLFTLFIGKLNYKASSINFFRAFGVDLMYLIIPTAKVHWLWDKLGLSIFRNKNFLFGDLSVCRPTFILPVLIAGGFAWWRIRKKNKLSIILLSIVLFSFYMSLGPSVKINSVKPEHVKRNAMTSEYAVVSTKNAFLSRYFPGFKNMRVSYRWLALTFFGLWVIIVIGISPDNLPNNILKKIFLFFLVLIIISNIPILKTRLKKQITFRNAIYNNMDNGMIKDLKVTIKKGEKVLFLPYRNDFSACYIASRLGIYAFNIGGNKNLEEARLHWPETIKKFKMSKFDAGCPDRIITVLQKKEADVVILTHVDLMREATRWADYKKYKPHAMNLVEKLRKYDHVSITIRDMYTAIRLEE